MPTPPFLAHTGGCAGLVGVDVVMWCGQYEKIIIIIIIIIIILRA
jgi:hypothetical protein